MSNGQAALQLAANLEAARTTHRHIEALAEPLERAADAVRAALLAGNKLLCCGNGGSAADSAHLCAEIAGRYKLDRPGYAAIDLTANAALVTALANDFPPEQVFARQVQAFGAADDVLIAFTTSGRSTNIRLALEMAPAKRMRTIVFLGRDGGACKGLAEIELLVPGDSTTRIQEAHLLLYHTLCDLIEPALVKGR